MLGDAIGRLEAVIRVSLRPTGSWTDDDQRELEVLLGDLPRVFTKHAFVREFRAVRRRLIARFDVPFPPVKVLSGPRKRPTYSRVDEIPEGHQVRDVVTGIVAVKRGSGLEPVN